MSGLKYRILWVDDNIETFIELAIDKGFEEFLENLGFIPEIIKFETEDKVLEHLKSDRKFDLILSDFNLADDGRGDSLIGKIREGQIFTEVLFYSGQANFIETAKNLYQDRVSFFSLESDEGFRGFKSKVNLLINLTISKLQELNNIRGLVMSETSILDVMIEEILIEVMTEGKEHAEALKTYMIDKVKENNEQRTSMFDKIEDLSNAELVKHRILIDANKKSRVLNEFLKKSGLANEEPFKKFHENYEKDVLSIRNDLAHAKSNTIDGIEYLIISRKDGEQPIKLGYEECTAIRGNLRKYSEILHKIKGFVASV